MDRQSVVIVDYGIGNVYSVANACEYIANNACIEISRDAQKINNADRLILPGVGAIKDCMVAIETYNLDKILSHQLLQKPILAICVGMQTLMRLSYENNGVDCMGFFNADVTNFLANKTIQDQQLKVPHMGWNQVQQKPHAVWSDITNHSAFYFVHSYFVHSNNLPEEQILGRCEYGTTFAAAVIQPNLIGVQFHPEKSHADGLQFLNNFMQWDGTLS